MVKKNILSSLNYLESDKSNDIFLKGIKSANKKQSMLLNFGSTELLKKNLCGFDKTGWQTHLTSGTY